MTHASMILKGSHPLTSTILIDCTLMKLLKLELQD